MKSNKLIEDYHRHSRYQLAWTIPAVILTLGLLFISWPLESTIRQSVYGAIYVASMAIVPAGVFLAIMTWMIASTHQMKVKWWVWLISAMWLSLSVIGLMIALILDNKNQVDLTRTFGVYFQNMFYDPGRIVDLYIDWINTAFDNTNMPISWAGALVIALFLTFTGMAQNPHDDRRSIHGNSRLATYKDLKRWRQWRDAWFSRKRQAISFLDDGGIVLGRFKHGLRSSTFLRRNETLTALALAAPGLGKTQGIAIPTILSKGMDTWSLFIFDIKGELYEKTAGYRSRVGPVVRFEPSGDRGARWNPLSPSRSLPDKGAFFTELTALEAELTKLVGPEDAQDTRIGLQTMMRNDADWRETLKRDPSVLCSEDVSFVSMSDKERQSIIETGVIPHARKMASYQAQRETYWRKLSMGLVKEPEGGGGGNAQHFIDRARAAGFALMGLTTSRCERDGVEPNFGRLIDLWSNALADAGGNIDDDPQEQTDAVTLALKSLIDECKAYGYPEQIRQELIDLRTAGEEEKGGIFSSLANGLNIFKLSTVRERTSTSDFALEDMRGMRGKDGKSYPLTLYLVVSLENIKSMAQIMIMLTEAMQSRLISQDASVAAKSRAVLFLLDEFAQIPKMQTLLSSPAVGRSQRVGNLLIAQSYGQIEGTYGQTGLKEIKDTTEWKLVYPLTDASTAKDISEMIGQETIEDASESGSYTGFRGMISAMFDGMTGKQVTTHVNKSRSLKGRPLFSPSDLMSTDNGGKMAGGQHIVLALRKYNRPIVCETPFAYSDKRISKLMQIEAPLPDPDGQNNNGMGFCGKLAHLHHAPGNDNEETVAKKGFNPFRLAG